MKLRIEKCITTCIVVLTLFMIEIIGKIYRLLQKSIVRVN